MSAGSNTGSANAASASASALPSGAIAAPSVAGATGTPDVVTYSDVVRVVHSIEHAARDLPYGERTAVTADLYAAVTSVAALTDAKAKAAAASKHAAASKVDAKFAASAHAHVHSGAYGAGGKPNAAAHAYAPAVSAEELKTFRLELSLGALLSPAEVPHSGDKLSSTFFAGQWRKAQLRWGPPSPSLQSTTLVPSITVLWPKTPAQVTACLAANQTYPPISNPSGMWLLRDTAGDGHTSAKFYVVDGAYRAAYLADPKNKPPYAIAWDVFVIERDPKFAFWTTQWNQKKHTGLSAAFETPAVPAEHASKTEIGVETLN